MRTSRLVLAYPEGLRQCPYCEFYFAPDSPRRVYCSHSCRTNGSAEKRGARRKRPLTERRRRQDVVPNSKILRLSSGDA